MKRCDCNKAIEDWQDYCDECSPLECRSPDDFGVVMESARKASKKFKCNIKDLRVGTDWGSINFYKPTEN